MPFILPFVAMSLVTILVHRRRMKGPWYTPFREAYSRVMGACMCVRARVRAWFCVCVRAVFPPQTHTSEAWAVRALHPARQPPAEAAGAWPQASEPSPLVLHPPRTQGIAVATFGALVLVQLIRHGGVDSPAYLIGYHLSGALAQVRGGQIFGAPCVWGAGDRPSRPLGGLLG